MPDYCVILDNIRSIGFSAVLQGASLVSVAETRDKVLEVYLGYEPRILSLVWYAYMAQLETAVMRLNGKK